MGHTDTTMGDLYDKIREDLEFRKEGLQRNQSRCTPEPKQPSGFFLKKKPPSRLCVRLRILWFRSKQCGHGFELPSVVPKKTESDAVKRAAEGFGIVGEIMVGPGGRS